MKLLYLDSSALVKLVAPEPESEALRSYLASYPQVASSALAQVEVRRAVARAGGSQTLLDRAREVLSRVTLVAMDDPILEVAADLAPSNLRSLDAIHLATALALGTEVDALVGYDERLNEAAGDAGLQVVSPK